MKNLVVILIAFMLVFSACGKKEQNPAEKTYKIAFIYFGPDVACDITIKGFLETLKEAGYEEGKNLEVTKSHAGGEIANIPQLVKNADNKGYDVIVPLSTPVLAACAAGVSKTKVVFCYTFDPIGAGAGKTFEDHLPNFTGVASFPPMTEAFDFFPKLFPQITKIGTVYNSSEANSIKATGLAREIAGKKGIELVEATVIGTNEITQAIQSLIAKQVQFVFIYGDNTAIQGLDGIISMSTKANIPVLLTDADFTDKGALAAVGFDILKTGKKAGEMVVRVLKGENPKDIPFINYAPQRIILNNKAAQTLGITIPEDLLKQYEVIK